MKAFEKSLYRQRTGLYFFFTVVVMMILLITSAGARQKSLLIGFEKGEDSETIPEGWKHIAYFGKAKNTISLISEGKRTIVHMKSLNSISALITNPDADIEQYPIIAWRWKVDRAVGMAIEAKRDRNDCAARVRVIFGTNRKNDESFTIPVVKRLLETVGLTAPDMEPSGTKIDYIWGNHAEKDEILDHPLAKNHKVVVVEKGNERAGQWIWEKRNLRKDYCQFFGSEPPDILAIAVLTDTDQTNEGVEAYYSNITLMSE